MAGNDNHFLRMPLWLARREDLPCQARLTWSAAEYLGKVMGATPSKREIARLLATDQRNVTRSAARLREAGLMSQQGYSALQAEGIDNPEVRVSDPQPVRVPDPQGEGHRPSEVRVSDPQPVRATDPQGEGHGPSGVRVSGPQGEGHKPSEVRVSDPPKIDKNKKIPAAAEERADPAAAGLTGQQAENLEALHAAGVGEPKATELAQLPGVSPGMIRELASRSGKGVGSLVLDLPIRAKESIRLQDERRQAHAAAERRRAERVDATANAEAIAVVACGFPDLLAAADPSEVERAVKAVMDSQPLTRRRVWEQIGLAGSPKLQRLVAERLGLLKSEVAA